MRILRLAFVIAGLLLAVLVVRALSLPSRQLRPEPAPALALDEAALAERLAASLRFPTISVSADAAPAREDFLAFQRWLAGSYPRLHATLALERVSELSLLFTWRGSRAELEPAVFLAHQDVVPVADLERWAHPPFDGVVADGFVWGRGAIDDKSQVVGLCEAIEHLLASGFAPERTLLFVFGHDEEVGGAQGAANIAALLASRGVRAAFVVDEGLAILANGAVPMLDRPAALIGVAEKGSATLEIVANGVGGHSSTPPRHTAAGTLARAIQQLEASPFPGGIGGVTRGFFDHLAPELPLLARLPLANLWLFAKPMDWLLSGQPAVNAMLRTTTAVTMLSGSPKDNVLPSQAIATVNFRILPGDTGESVLARVRSLVGADDVEVRFKYPSRDPSAVSPVDAPSFGMLQRTIGEIFPDAVVAPGLVVAGTDSRHFESVTPNVYRFGPFRFDTTDLKRAHGIDERIAIANYADGVRFYVRLLGNASRPFETK
jgi:carboxypeptidase PM20D1